MSGTSFDFTNLEWPTLETLGVLVFINLTFCLIVISIFNCCNCCKSSSKNKNDDDVFTKNKPRKSLARKTVRDVKKSRKDHLVPNNRSVSRSASLVSELSINYSNSYNNNNNSNHIEKATLKNHLHQMSSEPLGKRAEFVYSPIPIIGQDQVVSLPPINRAQNRFLQFQGDAKSLNQTAAFGSFGIINY